MAAPHALVLRAEGTNCEHETAHAWRLVGASADILHVQALIENPRALETAQIVTLPGGFCYGDDISAGKILATEVRARLKGALSTFIERGGLVLGICNGFQALVKTGFLPGPTVGDATVTLAFNTHGRYEDRWVRLKPVKSNCPLFAALGSLEMPIAHAEGRVVTRTEGDAESLFAKGHVPFTYVDDSGSVGGFPVNPNGSVLGIASLCDHTGRVIGLMPHPERNIHRTHHPRWTSRAGDGVPDGVRFFEAAVAALR